MASPRLFESICLKDQLEYKGIRREISLQSFVKKPTFQTVIFVIYFVTMNRHTYKLLKNIIHDAQTKGNGDKYGLTQLLLKLYFILYRLKVWKSDL